MSHLTPKEKHIYDFIKQHTDQMGYAPTYEEIRARFGYKAISSIQQFVEQLTQKGYLRGPLKKKQSRGLEVVEASSPYIASIPLEGSIAAGKFSEAIHHREVLEIPKNLLKSGEEYFALKIKGDSMINDGIFDGDTAIIRRQAVARNGQTVVAMLENEATIKRFYRRDHGIELHPANPMFDIIHVEPQAPFSILGILSSLIRRLE